MKSLVEVKKQQKIKELGVFASVNIKKDKIIEMCPLVLLPQKEMKFIEKTQLNRYYFDYNKEYFAVVFGYGSLYNHSFTPNADFDMDLKTKTMRITSLRDIKKGEEIYINYNGDPNDKTPLHKWFDPKFKDLISSKPS